MALDPTILQGIKLPSDYEAQRIKLGDAAVMAEHNQLKLDSEKKAVADQEATTAIAKKYYNSETNEFDDEGFFGELGTIDPIAAVSMKTKYKEGVAEQRKKHFEAMDEQFKITRSILGGVEDQKTYDMALAQAKTYGVDTSTFPTVYDPAFIEKMTYDVELKHRELLDEIKINADARAEEKLSNAGWVIQDAVGPDGVTPVKVRMNTITGAVAPLVGLDGASVGAIPKGKATSTRQPPAKVIEGLASQANMYDEFKRLSQEFTPAFGGNVVLGNLKTTIDSRNPMANQKAKAATAFWKDMEMLDASIRHGLFGAALTKTELDSWNRATVSRDMSPDVIKRNLATRERVMRSAIAKVRAGLVEAYDPTTIDATLGTVGTELAKAAPTKKAPKAAADTDARAANMRAQGISEETIAEILGQ